MLNYFVLKLWYFTFSPIMSLRLFDSSHFSWQSMIRLLYFSILTNEKNNFSNVYLYQIHFFCNMYLIYISCPRYWYIFVLFFYITDFFQLVNYLYFLMWSIWKYSLIMWIFVFWVFFLFGSYREALRNYSWLRIQ